MQYQLGSTKEYNVEKYVDYLAVTSKLADPPFATKVYQICKSVNKNYDMCEMHHSGALHMWHSKNSRVGHHWLFQGDCLRWIRANLLPDTVLVRRALEHGRISRIDIAITSTPIDGTVHEFKPQEVAIATIAGLLKSRLKPAKDIADNLVTQTKYIGNRQTRKRLFRAYDKGEDMGLLGNITMRYELETRKDANVVGRMVADKVDMGAIMKRYIDFPSIEVWQKIMDAEPAQVRHLDEPMSADEKDRADRMKKWLWLQDSIAPMIAKLLIRDGKADAIEMQHNEQFRIFLNNINENIYKNGKAAP